ncbi:MAG: YggS family pyridoxal phosphate-dependent enzyme [Bacteroidales bacterium]|nr:YggS family pyridoxal phosphate-dependent enzyme [Bacteroidales bacterium]
MSIASNINDIRSLLPEHVKLIAVSKFKPVSDLMEAYNAGQRLFGENKAQEMTAKHEVMPNDIEWHFIGHLQTNKIKYIIPYVHCIHSIDSAHLLAEVDKQAAKHGRTVPCLLQFHIATEETKFGFSYEEAVEMLQSPEFRTWEHIAIHGVMGMATNTEDNELIRKEFRTLKSCFDRLKADYFPQQESFREISMGMTGDYPIAIEEGSTMVRIGSAIFGARNYQL